MHANPNATLKYTLAISLGIATLPLTGAGAALKVAWRGAVTNGWRGITSLALRTGLNLDTLRMAANASRRGDNGNAALIILTTQINRFKAAGTLTANLPFVKNAIQRLAKRFPGIAAKCNQLRQMIGEAGSTMNQSGRVLKATSEEYNIAHQKLTKWVEKFISDKGRRPSTEEVLAQVRILSRQHRLSEMEFVKKIAALAGRGTRNNAQHFQNDTDRNRALAEQLEKGDRNGATHRVERDIHSAAGR